MHASACECMRMHASACECMRMHANTVTAEVSAVVGRSAVEPLDAYHVGPADATAAARAHSQLPHGVLALSHQGRALRWPLHRGGCIFPLPRGSIPTKSMQLPTRSVFLLSAIARSAFVRRTCVRSQHLRPQLVLIKRCFPPNARALQRRKRLNTPRAVRYHAHGECSWVPLGCMGACKLAPADCASGLRQRKEKLSGGPRRRSCTRLFTPTVTGAPPAPLPRHSCRALARSYCLSLTARLPALLLLQPRRFAVVLRVHARAYPPGEPGEGSGRFRGRRQRRVGAAAAGGGHAQRAQSRAAGAAKGGGRWRQRRPGI